MSLQTKQKSTKTGPSSPVRPINGNSGSSRTEAKSISVPVGLRRPVTSITFPRHHFTTIDPEKWIPSWTTRRCSSMVYLEEAKSSAARKTLTTIRRSISFDRIATSYLTGEWPSTGNFHNQLNLLHCPIILTTDKWTQTNEDIEDDDCEMSGFIRGSNSFVTNNNISKEFQTRILSNRMQIDSSHKFDNSKAQLLSSSSLRLGVVALSRKKMITPCQQNAEGFNQEVEKLIQNKLNRYQEIKTTPDGHRAPVAKLLSMSSVNTQTLSDDKENHFMRISEDVVAARSGSPCLPIIDDDDDDDDDISSVSFVQLKSSEMRNERRNQPTNVIISPNPVISKVYRKRQAPDGCDEMDTKMFEDFKQEIYCDMSSPVKTGSKSFAKYRIPSEHSAFCPLIKMYVSQRMHLMLSQSPVSATAGNNM